MVRTDAGGSDRPGRAPVVAKILDVRGAVRQSESGGGRMAEYRVSVRITPRPGLLDPEGKAVGGALRSLGFEDVGDVHVGRLIVLDIAADSVDAANERAREMCEKLLANPVTEDFAIEVETERGEPAGSA